MRPIRQTRFGWPSGNCLLACVASILDLPLEEVPDGWSEEDWLARGHTEGYWHSLQLVLNDWLIAHGRVYCTLQFDPPLPFPLWRERLEARLPHSLLPLRDFILGVRLARPDAEGRYVGHALVGSRTSVLHDPAGRPIEDYQHDAEGRLLIEEIIWLEKWTFLETQYDLSEYRIEDFRNGMLLKLEG